MACCPFVWGITPLAELPQLWQQPDLVVAADVVYQPTLVAPLLQAVTQLGERIACWSYPATLAELLPVLTMHWCSSRRH